MTLTQLFCRSLLCCAIASPAFADVTLKSKGSATGAAVGSMTGDKIEYVKGAKMRTDQTTGAGRKLTTIVNSARRSRRFPRTLPFGIACSAEPFTNVHGLH